MTIQSHSGTPGNPDWHWPRFGATLCGVKDDRERLGLPDHYQRARFEAAMSTSYARWRSLSVDRLLDTIESADMPLPDRIVCGNLLALVGDPRVSTDAPAMVQVHGGAAHIGLVPGAVDAIMTRYQDLGLERPWIDKETPRHAVTLLPFKLGRYPVTNHEYRDFLLDTGYAELPSSWALRQFPLERANHPVYTVSATAADAYAQWLRRRTGRGFRLPGEAEWEWAAAGPEGLEFPWGSQFDADRANTAETGLLCSTPVGLFASGQSVCGALDMAGNVEEYVADNYAPYPGGSFVADHLVQIHGDYRVARGGSFARFRDLARNQRRHGHNPRSATYAMGFRLAETL